MRDQTRRAFLTGGLAGFLMAGTLALPSVLPPAVADEEPARTLLKTADQIFPKPIDGDTFAKPEWTVEPWVSTDVISQTSVRKIGYGRTTFVAISKTATGTYSSDGLQSPYIRYPGIIRNAGSDSFMTIVPFKGGRMYVGSDGACVRVEFGMYC
jgi:hypothetical protein